VRIGIVGAGGFIGSYLVERLQARAQGDLRLFWRNPEVSPPQPAEVIYGDLTSYPDCQRFARDLDVIYYLAHQHSPVDSDLDQASDAALNLIPLLTLLKAIENLRTRPTLVYFSSGGAVYGTAAKRVPFREDQPCRPTCSYGVQKLAAEHYLRIASCQGHLSSVILRVGNAFGTLLPEHRMQGLIGVAVNNIVHGRPVRIFGDPENVRDYVHLSDVCDLALRVIEDPPRFSVVNAGTGQGFSVREVLRMVEACSPAPVEIQYDAEAGRKLTAWVVLDSGKARCEFQWEARVKLRDGIAAMMQPWQTPAARDSMTTACGQA